MAPPVSTAHALDLNQARQRIAAEELTADAASSITTVRYRLLTSLQTTLDVDKLLPLFLHELETLVFYDGVLYSNQNQVIEHLWGQRRSHHCHYRLIIHREQLGELYFYRDSRFDDAELEIIESLLSALLLPLRNALLYRQALTASLTDPLTSTGNRLALSSQLKREINLARRYRQPMSVLVIDIDKFKRINDTYGHATGDVVLKELAETIRRVNRSTDLCFRYGGEEFVILLSNTGSEGALVIADRLRSAVSQTIVSTETGPLQLTVSIGVSTLAETDNEHTLIQRADKAMYQAKHRGGNHASFL